MSLGGESRALLNSLLDDWVKLPDNGQFTVGEWEEVTSEEPSGYGRRPNPSQAAVPSEHATHEIQLLEGFVECDGYDLAVPINELQHFPTVPGNLENELRYARTEVQQTRLDHLAARQRLSALERLVGGQELPECVHRVCLPCSYSPEHDDDASSQSSDMSANVPNEAEEYFQVEREAYVRNERLVELDFEYKEAQAARGRNQYSRDGNESAWQAFETRYKRERQELSEALAVAHYRLYVRRNACAAQRIDLERFRYRRD